MPAARLLETPHSAPQDDVDPKGPRLAEDSLPPQASPARELQASLTSELEYGWRRDPPRWPGALRLAVIMGGSAGLWALIIAGVKAAL